MKPLACLLNKVMVRIALIIIVPTMPVLVLFWQNGTFVPGYQSSISNHEPSGSSISQEAINPANLGANEFIVEGKKFAYVLNPNQTLCKYTGEVDHDEEESNETVFVLAVVIATPEKILERLNMRGTWSNPGTYTNLKTVFIVGLSEDESVNANLRQESFIYNDIVQVDMKDSKDKSNLKTLIGIKWAISFCSQAKFVLKIDDDIMVTTWSLLAFLEKQRTLENTIICHICYTPFSRKFKEVIAARRAPMLITYGQGDPKLIPKYCADTYLLTMDMAEKVFEASQTSQRPVEKATWSGQEYEDPYITGNLARQLKSNYMCLNTVTSKNNRYKKHAHNEKFFFNYFVKVQSYEDIVIFWRKLIGMAL